MLSEAKYVGSGLGMFSESCPVENGVSRSHSGTPSHVQTAMDFMFTKLLLIVIASLGLLIDFTFAI